MAEVKNYLSRVKPDLLHTEMTAALVVEEGDKVDYGVIGMKWGKRRSPAQLKAASEKKGGGEGGDDKSKAKLEPLSTKSGDGKASLTDTVGRVEKKGDGKAAAEPSAERYERLREQAKLGRAKQMSDDDLKFFNARTEALAKISKLNKQNPGWISTATKSAIQKSAQKSMQAILDKAAEQFIVLPINESIGKKAAEAAAKAAAKKKK